MNVAAVVELRRAVDTARGTLLELVEALVSAVSTKLLPELVTVSVNVRVVLV